MKSDWRKPFLELQTSLKPLYDANRSIYHAVLLSTTRSEGELKPIIEMLEPAYRKNLLLSIPVETDGCSYHSHLFFADDRRGLDQLGRYLDGIEDWMTKVPGGLIPSFDIPPISNPTHRNLIRWISVVYYLAWASDAVSLEAELEFQASVDRIGFFPFEECPQPPGCLPIQWLIHQGVSTSRVPKWKQKFEDCGERIPDVIDAYLTDELMRSSLIAIDILAFVLNGERRMEAVEKESGNQTPKAERPRSQKVEKEVNRLKIFLAGWHNSKRPNPENSDNDDRGPFEPLTAFEIADKLGWITPKGRLDQTKVSRRMEVIYGTAPMDKYVATFSSTGGSDRFRTTKGSQNMGERFIEPDEPNLD